MATSPSPTQPTTPPRSRITHHASRLWPILGPALVLFILALAIRAWGVRWSLPYVGHVDEPKIVDSAVKMIKTGDLNPHLFIWPSFWIYAQALLYKINLAWGMWRGYYVGPESLPDTNHVFALAPPLYLWGRNLSAVVGALAVAVLFLLGRKMFNWRVGLVAAMVLLVAPLHVEYSHYLVTDVAVGFFGLLTLFASWRLATRPGFRIALLCGLLIGLTAATKYNGVYVALVPATALLLAPLAGSVSWMARLRRLALWGLAMVLVAAAVFLLANPYVILDWTHWSRGFVFQIDAYLPAENLSQMAASVVEHVTAFLSTDKLMLIPAALGALLMLGSLIVGRLGEGRGQKAEGGEAKDAVDGSALVSREWLIFLLLIPFPIIYTLLMSRFKLIYERNLIITMPFLCLLAGYLVDRLAGWASLLIGRLVRGSNVQLYGSRYSALAVVLALLLVAEPARQMINFDRYMAEPESRNLAATWLLGELRNGKRAAVELHPLAFCAEAPFSCPAPDVLAPNDSLTDHPPEWYAQRGYDYVVLSGEDYLNIGDPAKDRARDKSLWAQYKDLPGPADGPRLFGGDRVGGKGPAVLVLRVGNGISDLPVMHKLGARFGDIAELWGYDFAPVASTDQQIDPLAVPEGEFTRGAAVGLNLYLRALKDGTQISGNWTVAVHLVAPDGSKVAQIDVAPISHGRQRPAQQWYRNEFLPGAYNLPIRADLRPGDYTVRVALYDAPAGPALKAQLPDGSQTDYLDLATVNIK